MVRDENRHDKLVSLFDRYQFDGDINGLVFALYGLTEEEIGIVEGGDKHEALINFFA